LDFAVGAALVGASCTLHELLSAVGPRASRMGTTDNPLALPTTARATLIGARHRTNHNSMGGRARTYAKLATARCAETSRTTSRIVPSVRKDLLSTYAACALCGGSPISSGAAPFCTLHPVHGVPLVPPLCVWPPSALAKGTGFSVQDADLPPSDALSSCGL